MQMSPQMSSGCGNEPWTIRFSYPLVSQAVAMSHYLYYSRAVRMSIQITQLHIWLSS